jgi:nitrate reductase NapE component
MIGGGFEWREREDRLTAWALFLTLAFLIFALMMVVLISAAGGGR